MQKLFLGTVTFLKTIFRFDSNITKIKLKILYFIYKDIKHNHFKIQIKKN